MINKPTGSERFKQWLGLANYAREALTRGQRRYLVASVAVHLLVVILMTWSWSSTEAVKTYVIPKSIEARVLTSQEIDQLPYKKKQRAEQDAKEKRRLEELRKKKEEQKKKEQAKKRAEEERKRKEAKKEAERKKAIVEQKKKQQELEKQKAEKAARDRQSKEEAALKERQQKELAKQRELERQEVDKLKQLADERKQKLREQQLAERLKGIEDLKAAEDSDEPVFDVDEKTRYLSIIRSRIESRWHKPPNSEGYNVVLRIELFPSGELSSAAVIKTSGNSALDESALRAVRAVGKFEVPSEQAFFEKYFRSFQMSFKPSD